MKILKLSTILLSFLFLIFFTAHKSFAQIPAASRVTCNMTAMGLKNQGVKTLEGKQYRQYWVVQGKNYQNALKIEGKVDNVSQPSNLIFWRHPSSHSDNPNFSCWYGKPQNVGDCATEPIFPASTKSQVDVPSLITNLNLTSIPSTQLGQNIVVCNSTLPGVGQCSGNPFLTYPSSGFQNCNTTETPADSRVMLNIVCNKKDQGNADCNNKVDENDYQMWKTKYQSGTLCDEYNISDFDGDGCSNLLDFEIWRENQVSCMGPGCADQP